jgi:polysaccharide pyruvyl transferase WcaK-like protein
MPAQRGRIQEFHGRWENRISSEINSPQETTLTPLVSSAISRKFRRIASRKADTAHSARTETVVLVNAWHDDNAGDSAIVHTCITLAREKWPEAAIEVRTMLSASDPSFPSWHHHLDKRHPDVAYKASYFPEPHTTGTARVARLLITTLASTPLLADWIPTLGRVRATTEIKGATAMVIIGGSDLFQLRRPLITGALRLRRLLEPARLAERVNVPTYFWGHTVGPLQLAHGRRFVAARFAAATEIVVRERISADLVNDLAPDQVVRLIPDLAFGLGPAKDDHARTLPSGTSRTFAAIVPRGHLAGTEGRDEIRLIDQFADLANRLTEGGLVDEVLIVPQVAGPSTIENDEAMALAIVRTARNPRVTLSATGQSPHELRDLYADARGVIAVRLHGAILAIAAGTPAYALSYFTPKTQGVFESLGMGSSWTTISDFSVDDVIDWWQRGTSESSRMQIAAKASEQFGRVSQLT